MMSLPSRNTLHLFGLLVLVTLTLLGACAAPEIQRRTDLFWPLPPDPPRISFVMSLSEPRDMGVRRGFFRRATEFLFGREEPPRLIRPHSVFSDGRGRLYVSDTGLQVVHVFDLDRRSYRQVFRIPGGRLLSPIGVAVDPQGRLFVSDSELDRVVVFDERGRYTRSLGEATPSFVWRGSPCPRMGPHCMPWTRGVTRSMYSIRKAKNGPSSVGEGEGPVNLISLLTSRLTGRAGSMWPIH